MRENKVFSSSASVVSRQEIPAIFWQIRHVLILLSPSFKNLIDVLIQAVETLTWQRIEHFSQFYDAADLTESQCRPVLYCKLSHPVYKLRCLLESTVRELDVSFAT